MQHKIFCKLISVFYLCIFLFGISFAQDHWEVINSSTMQGVAIRFATPQIGWVSTLSPPFGLYKSVDGGYTWSGVLSNQEITSSHITFFNERRGFIGHAWKAAVTYDGDTWEVFRLPENIYVEDAVYLDSLCLIGTANILLGEDWNRRQITRSNDGGRTWELLFTEDTHIDFFGKPLKLNSTTIILGAHNSFWRTTDRGDTWQANDMSSVEIYTVVDSTTLFQARMGTEVGSTAGIDRSTDAGYSWTEVWNDSANAGRFISVYDLQFSDIRHGWISLAVYPNNYLLMHTSDGGDTWLTDSLAEYHFPIISMSFLDSTTGWAVAPGGPPILPVPTLVYRWSTNSGTGSGWNPAMLPQDLRILSVYPNPFNSKTQIMVNISNPENTQVILFDLLGRLVDAFTHNVLVRGINQLNWEGSNYATGNYFLNVSDGKQSVTTKLLLVK